MFFLFFGLSIFLWRVKLSDRKEFTLECFANFVTSSPTSVSF
jgi:hypothetical protein